MIYKCKNCGSALKYDITLGKMVCDYCNSEFDMGEISESVLQDAKTAEDMHTMETKVYVCSACGAELMINDVETATFCAYCGQPTIVFDRVSKIRKPDVILPFAITKEEAHALIQKKLNKGLFVPGKIRKIEPEVVRGIFIPFMLSDVHYEGKYLVKGVVRSESATAKKHFFRHAVADFKNLPVDASKKFNDESAARLAPFSCENLKPFDAAYLSGFYADTGDESGNDIEWKVKAKAKSSFEAAVLASVKADKKEIVESSPKIKIKNSRYAMLPVWFFACNEGDIRCTIIVNGYTGKVVGAVPVDKGKVVALSMAVGIPIVAALACALGFLTNAMFSAGSDVDSDIFEAIGAAVIGIGGAIGAKFKAFKKSIGLSRERDIFDYAKNRQEGR